MKNEQYDEAIELSQSHNSNAGERKRGEAGDLLKMKTQSVSNRHFDEALEISQNSDESVDSQMRNLKSTAERKLADPEDRKKSLGTNSVNSTATTIKTETKFTAVVEEPFIKIAIFDIF